VKSLHCDFDFVLFLSIFINWGCRLPPITTTREMFS
jgi:hypothetical protein